MRLDGIGEREREEAGEGRWKGAGGGMGGNLSRWHSWHPLLS